VLDLSGCFARKTWSVTEGTGVELEIKVGKLHSLAYTVYGSEVKKIK
jgi:hypothetical protein